MDATDILATGGMGGATGVVVYILYKLLQKGVRSKCCGYTVEVGLQTPKTITIVDETHHTSSQVKRDADEQRSSRGSSSQDPGRTQGQGGKGSEGDGSTSSHFTTENPLTISVPKPLQ